MSWILTEKGQRVEPIPGVDWRELTDEEFAAAEAELEARRAQLQARKAQKMV